ncbi:retrovirus-related pol polyprotein from transposon TNT 1-94 [Tanacetum coccineum]
MDYLISMQLDLICDCADTMADVNVNAPAEQAPAMAPPTQQSNLQDFGRHSEAHQLLQSFHCFLDISINLYSAALGHFDNNNAFSSPPTPDVLIKFVNDLGYPKVIRALSDVVTNDMFQPWRALTTIINLCLTRKTSRFERPRAPVLQILWGVVKRAHIDYAERMWEEFTQSIHTFIEDKKNLAQHTQGKKKATLIVIPSVRFTKLIIHHLQSKHKFHPRPGSPLHFPNEESILGYLKFSAKGTKREVFGMPILNNLITANIQGEQYYNAYLAKQTQKSSLQLVDEFVDEGVPVNEPRFGDEEADLQKAVEESLKDVQAAHQGKRERESGEEQAAQVLLNLRTPKKKSPTDQYIFQRRSSVPTKPSGHDESSSLYAELGLTNSETISDEEVPGTKAGDQDEGQARPNPGIQDEGHARSNPSDVAVSQPQPSHVVHTGPNLEHMDAEVTDSSIQQNPEQMDEEFTTTAYPNVQENLKLPTEDQVRLEEPANSAGTLSSLQNLDKEFSFTNQFLEEKSQEDEPEKTIYESGVSTTVQAPLPTSTATRIGKLEQHMADLLQENLALEEILDKHRSRLYKLENLDIPHQVSKAVDEIVTDAVDWAIQALLSDRFRYLLEADIKEILHHRMWETKSYKTHKDHKNLYESLEKSMDRDHSDQLLTDLAEARRKNERRHKSPKHHLGLHLISHPSSTTCRSIWNFRSFWHFWIVSTVSSSSTSIYQLELRPSVSSTPDDLNIDDDSVPDAQVHSSDDEDIGNDHIPKVNLKHDWWKPLSEEDKPATPKPARSIPSSDLPVPTHNWASALASTYAPPPKNSLLA